ncbi:hypothetical protein E2C01_036878 [Portunus trituberculatus]|uniref:Uncharacterized protein n=1 Tax=Portunus trituberculatus TaxID=210409 RepID=A0A5B7FCF2_PORTR|nr:hypothetical protein [Portunus trituberculatus]
MYHWYNDQAVKELYFCRRKLCGSLNSSIRQLLDLTLHKINNLLVSFRSDGSNEKSGFRLLYHAH